MYPVLTNEELELLSDDVKNIIGILIFEPEKISIYTEQLRKFQPRNGEERAKYSYLKYVQFENMSEFDFWKTYEDLFLSGSKEGDKPQPKDINRKKDRLLKAQKDGKINKYIPISNLKDSELEELYAENFGEIDREINNKKEKLLIAQKAGFVNKFVPIATLEDHEIEDLYKAEELRKAKQEEFNRLSDPERVIKFEDKQLVWIDTTTNLMWEVKNKKNRNDEYDWQDAMNYANSLNGQKYGGFDNWRLPTKKEAISLSRFYYGTYDSNWSKWFNENKKRQLSNADNLGTFVKKPLSFVIGGSSWSAIWTSTINETYNTASWIVYFDDGDDNWNSQADDDFVVCVRDL